jgi:hypothetical protein
VYLPTITVVPGSPTDNEWWHQNRKLFIDIDNNVWGAGGARPVFFGYYAPGIVQTFFNGGTNAWATPWEAALHYEKNTWYTIEIEKTATQYFFRVRNAFTQALLKEAVRDITALRPETTDYLAIGDPHVNYYHGRVKIGNIRIANSGCGGDVLPPARPRGLRTR